MVKQKTETKHRQRALHRLTPAQLGVLCLVAEECGVLQAPADEARLRGVWLSPLVERPGNTGTDVDVRRYPHPTVVSTLVQRGLLRRVYGVGTVTTGRYKLTAAGWDCVRAEHSPAQRFGLPGLCVWWAGKAEDGTVYPSGVARGRLMGATKPAAHSAFHEPHAWLVRVRWDNRATDATVAGSQLVTANDLVAQAARLHKGPFRPPKEGW